MQPPAPGVQPYGAVPPAAVPGQYLGAAGQYGHPGAPPGMPAGLPAGVQSASLWVRLEAAPEFNLCQRLKGPNNSFLNHIAKETGATVALRGRGSGVQVQLLPCAPYCIFLQAMHAKCLHVLGL